MIKTRVLHSMALVLAVSPAASSWQTAQSSRSSKSNRFPAAAAVAQSLPGAGESAPTNLNQTVDRLIARENQFLKDLRTYSPRVETYIQDFRADQDLGTVPTDDHYFLGRMDFRQGISVRSFLAEHSWWGHRVLNGVAPKFAVRYDPGAFAYPMVIDPQRFDRAHYQFSFVRREFLGEVRCLVFDVQPRPRSGYGLFLGRIWIEEHDDNVVRFNGTFAPAPRNAWYFHFDSWRENLQPGLWLPVYIYGEETDVQYSSKHRLHFKSLTRLWGYGLSKPNHEGELTRMVVDAPTPVQDISNSASDPSPVASQRQWESEAENNVLERLQKAGLVAPPGEVDKVLETVVNNLVVTNHLDNLPQVHCRVLLTTPLESLAIGDSIIMSRGLIDVLPDEASLAVMLAHELAHVVLGHTLTSADTRYAFDDRLLIPDEVVLQRLNFKPTEAEEAAADAKATDLLKNSPYKDQLGKAGLFLRALADAAPHTPQLTGAHLGSRLARGNQVLRMADLMSGAPELKQTRLDQVAALPLGARIKLDAWNDGITLMKSKPVSLISAREKMPFEVAPQLPYLTRYGESQQSANEPNPKEQGVAASNPRQ
jgi:hypothetical protein